MHSLSNSQIEQKKKKKNLDCGNHVVLKLQLETTKNLNRLENSRDCHT